MANRELKKNPQKNNYNLPRKLYSHGLPTLKERDKHKILRTNNVQNVHREMRDRHEARLQVNSGTRELPRLNA